MLDRMIAKGHSPSEELLNIVLDACISGKITSKVSSLGVADKQTFTASCVVE